MLFFLRKRRIPGRNLQLRSWPDSFTILTKIFRRFQLIPQRSTQEDFRIHRSFQGKWYPCASEAWDACYQFDYNLRNIRLSAIRKWIEVCLRLTSNSNRSVVENSELTLSQWSGAGVFANLIYIRTRNRHLLRFSHSHRSIKTSIDFKRHWHAEATC